MPENTTHPLPPDLDAKKARASKWFQELQERLISAFERIEDVGGPGYSSMTPGRFERTRWSRGETDATDEGGGVMALMRGRVLEKVGVHFSEVQGEFSEAFRSEIPGASEDPRFWACGVSLICHTRNPRAPAAHMNTRMIVTSQQWFGGGGDLNPMLPEFRDENHEDSRAFHAEFESACNKHNPDYYPQYKEWCDKYFWLPHRNEPRGVGGIFYDRHNSGDWEADFAFTQDVGRAFLEIYPPLIEKRMNEDYSDDEREQQLFQRGRYAEYNLLYDRGTVFGLKTGGNVDSILSSLPPEAKWP
ncbi:MAG: oxygen-dependent coproporphyrinogen oxidase [Pseudomonadota bacterium]